MGATSALTLLDLVEAYELVMQEHIITGANEMDFNLAVLAVELEIFCMPRRICIEGYYSDPVTVTGATILRAPSLGLSRRHLRWS